MFLHIFRPDRFGGWGRERKEKDKVEEKEDKSWRIAGTGFGVRGFCVFISDDGVSWHSLLASIAKCFTVPIPLQWSLLVAKEKPSSKPNLSLFFPLERSLKRLTFHQALNILQYPEFKKQFSFEHWKVHFGVGLKQLHPTRCNWSKPCSLLTEAAPAAPCYQNLGR